MWRDDAWAWRNYEEDRAWKLETESLLSAVFMSDATERMPQAAEVRLRAAQALAGAVGGALRDEVCHIASLT